MKKTRAFRGQRKQQKFVGCGCYLCTGHDKRELLHIKESIIDKQAKIVINETLQNLQPLDTIT